LASSWSSTNCMSLRGHTSTHSAVRGTERPSGHGRRPATGMGGSPCGSGSPSPGYLGQAVRSANWGVGMTTAFASSACSRAKARRADRSSAVSASSSTVCVDDHARYSLVTFSCTARRSHGSYVRPFFLHFLLSALGGSLGSRMCCHMESSEGQSGSDHPSGLDSSGPGTSSAGRSLNRSAAG
jgi:hypothetical protein